MTLSEYIRLACGDATEGEQALSDGDIADVLAGAVLSPVSRNFIRAILESGARASVLNRAGWVELPLSALSPDHRKWGCGLGGWLDGLTDVYIGGGLHPLGENESINNLTGIVTLLADPGEGAAVSVRTYLVDLPRAVHDALMLIAGSESRLAIKAGAGGADVDLSGLAEALRRQAREVMGAAPVEIEQRGDYPH
ncbi:MAG: hypothetical protein HRF49_01410 [bacterium]|jgi:hypothetical protein